MCIKVNGDILDQRKLGHGEEIDVQFGKIKVDGSQRVKVSC